MYVWIYIGISVPYVGRFYPVASMVKPTHSQTVHFCKRLGYICNACTLAFYNTNKDVQCPIHIFRHIYSVQLRNLFWTPLHSSNKNLFGPHLVAGFHETCFIRLSCIKWQITEMVIFVWKENCGLGILDIARDPFLDPFRRVGSGKTARSTLEYRPGLDWVMTCSWVQMLYTSS